MLINHYRHDQSNNRHRPESRASHERRPTVKSERWNFRNTLQPRLCGMAIKDRRVIVNVWFFFLNDFFLNWSKFFWWFVIWECRVWKFQENLWRNIFFFKEQIWIKYRNEKCKEFKINKYRVLPEIRPLWK